MDEQERTDRADRVTDALRAYRAADSSFQQRARSTTSLGDNELRIVQFLTTAPRHSATPTDIARHLGITSASTTALLDRLERAGQVRRAPHPSDRRSIVITPTDAAEEVGRSTLSRLDEESRRLAMDLSAAESDAVVDFLTKVARTAQPGS